MVHNPDLGGSPFKESGFDFGVMDKEYIENNLLVVFQFWNDCELFLPPTSVERWRKTYSRRLDILKYNKFRFDHETNKAGSKDSKILQKKIKEYTSVDILHSQDDFKSLVWPELLLSDDVVEKICMEYGKLFDEGVLAGFNNVRIEKSISGLIEFARASGSSKAILTLIASIIKLHHISLNSNITKINGLVEKVKKQMRDLIARFGRIKQTMNAFPHGIFLNGPLPPVTEFPPIVPPYLSNGQYNISILCWFDYKSNQNKKNVYGGEQWFSIKFCRSHNRSKSANSWVQYTLKFSSHNADIGVIVRNSFQDVLLTVKEDVVLDRSDDGKFNWVSTWMKMESICM